MALLRFLFADPDDAYYVSNETPEFVNHTARAVPAPDSTYENMNFTDETS